jgi:hypothetical protein
MYSCPDGPDPKKPDMSPARHASRRSMGQASTGIGPGLGRHLGTVARHEERPVNATGPTRPASPRPCSPTVGSGHPRPLDPTVGDGVYKLPPAAPHPGALTLVISAPSPQPQPRAPSSSSPCLPPASALAGSASPPRCLVASSPSHLLLLQRVARLRSSTSSSSISCSPSPPSTLLVSGSLDPGSSGAILPSIVVRRCRRPLWPSES